MSQVRLMLDHNWWVITLMIATLGNTAQLLSGYPVDSVALLLSALMLVGLVALFVQNQRTRQA